jgi:hypothetical protein
MSGKNIEIKTLDNGIKVRRKDNIHYTNYHFSDTTGHFFVVVVGTREIGTDFITPEMTNLGFKTLSTEEVERQHRGSIVHLLKLPKGNRPIPDAFIKYEDTIMTILRSAGATSYTFKDIACKTIQHEAHIISKTDDPQITESCMQIIREQLRGISEGWELSNNIV